MTTLAGNAQFTKVDNLAGHLSDLNVSDAKVGVLSVQGNLTVGGDVLQGGVQTGTVVGYTPTGVLAVASYTLVRTAGSSAVTVATDPQAITLPVGAVVKSISYVGQNTFTQSGGTFGIGTGALNAASTADVAVGTPTLANGAGGANLSLLGSTTTGDAATVVPASPSNYLNLDVVAASITVGQLCVTIEYSLLL